MNTAVALSVQSAYKTFGGAPARSFLGRSTNPINPTIAVNRVSFDVRRGEIFGVTSGLALIPLAIAGSIPGHEIEHPMSIVILGGLITSTVLNLFVVPSLYLRFAKSRSAARTGSAVQSA